MQTRRDFMKWLGGTAAALPLAAKAVASDAPVVEAPEQVGVIRTINGVDPDLEHKYIVDLKRVSDRVSEETRQFYESQK